MLIAHMLKDLYLEESGLFDVQRSRFTPGKEKNRIQNFLRPKPKPLEIQNLIQIF
jgi:hypothetical protein